MIRLIDIFHRLAIYIEIVLADLSTNHYDLMMDPINQLRPLHAWHSHDVSIRYEWYARPLSIMTMAMAMNVGTKIRCDAVTIKSFVFYFFPELDRFCPSHSIYVIQSNNLIRSLDFNCVQLQNVKIIFDIN